jgi:aspartyl-tRNA(Asn)/glutamyl-tRNA(Gln) amidotransferase subunit C
MHMTTPLTREDVVHVAKLARLSLTADEIDAYTGQLASILGHAEEISAIDTTGVEPMSHPLPMVNVFREDVVGAVLDRAEVLAQAPDHDGERFRVPRILGESSSGESDPMASRESVGGAS